MSEAPDLKSLGDDFSKKLESIVSSVGAVASNVSKLQEDNNVIKSKFDSLDTKKEKEDDNDLDAYEDPTEKEVKTIKQDLESLKNSQKQEKWVNEYERKCASFDTQAIQKFPHIKDENSEAFKKTQEFLLASDSIGKHPVTGKPLYAPDALLNAAYKAKVEYPNAFKVDEENDDYDDYNFNFGGGKRIKGREITDIQKQIASRLNVPITDRLKERAKAYNSKTIKKFMR